MYNKIESMLCSLIETTKCQFDSGVENVDTDEAGKVIDMIKDLSESLYHLGKYYTKYSGNPQHWGKAGLAYKDLSEHIEQISKGMPYDKKTMCKHTEEYVESITYDVKKLMTMLNDEDNAMLKEKLTAMITRL